MGIVLMTPVGSKYAINRPPTYYKQQISANNSCHQGQRNDIHVHGKSDRI